MCKCVWQGHFLVGRKEPTREKHRDAKEEKGPQTEGRLLPTLFLTAKKRPSGDNRSWLEMWGCLGQGTSSPLHQPPPSSVTAAPVHPEEHELQNSGARTPPSLGLLCSMRLLDRASSGQIKGRGCRWGMRNSSREGSIS